ncbi:MAG: hypothetical protein Q9213_006677 [Squamulea squamosa]
MPSRIYQTLLSRQRCLTSLELNWSDVSIDEMVGPLSSPSCLLRGLKDIERLRIMPSPNEVMPEVAGEILKQHSTIRDLEVELVHMHFDNDGGEFEEQLTSSGGIHALFRNLKPSSVHLRSLDLKGVNLSNCHGELLSALDLPALTYLSIAKCQYPEHLMTALAGIAGMKSMRLKGLMLHHSREWRYTSSGSLPDDSLQTDPLLAATNLLLANMPASLTRIWIFLRGFNELPHVGGLIHHSSTLQWLFIDIREQKGPNGVCIYSPADWQLLCKSLGNLQQLDMAYPEVVADCRVIVHSKFCDYVKETASMNTLKALGVNNWPLHSPVPGAWNRQSPDINHDLYRHSLSALATNILNMRRQQVEEIAPKPSRDIKQITPKRDSSPTELRVVSFGLCEECNWGYRLDPMSFVKSRVHVLGGEQKWKMEPVTKDSLEYDLPFEYREYDIDAMTHDIGEFEAGHSDDDDGW